MVAVGQAHRDLTFLYERPLSAHAAIHTIRVSYCLGNLTMSKRINIILPDSTVAVLDRVTTRGNRSRFIDRAVRQFVETEGRANLRTRLKEEAIANADRDLAMAAEWFPIEEEAWRMVEPTTRKRAGKPSRAKRS